MLIDTREANRYAGRKERLDLKAGHIPGAVSVPTREILNPDNTFRPAEEIRATFEKVGVTDPNNVIVLFWFWGTFRPGHCRHASCGSSGCRFVFGWVVAVVCRPK